MIDPSTGNANAISAGLDVLWHVNSEELARWLFLRNMEDK